MSFNRLPTEIKRLIVKMCNQADESYKISMPVRRGMLTDGDYTVWFGRSSYAISLVSKDLRAISAQYVFKIIKVSQMAKRIFATWILDSPICANFTTVDFNVSDPEQLSFAVFHVLPRLPNLKAIWGIDAAFTEGLFGNGGMVRVSKLKCSSSTSNEEAIHAWHKLKSIATRIVEWRVQLKEEEVEALLSIDPSIKSKIRSLSLSSFSYEGFPILESDSSRFPALLNSLPSLASLTVDPAIDFPSGQEYPSCISQTALSIDYPFHSTLTSFAWTGSRYSTPVDPSLLHFLARLESLRHLRIRSSAYEVPELFDREDQPELSQLITLELIGGGINGIDHLLDHVQLPRIKIITLDFDLNHDDHEELYDLDTAVAEDLYGRIFRFKETLRDVYLRANDGIYQVSLDHLKTGSFYGYKSEPPYIIHADWKPGAAEVVTSEHFSVRAIDDVQIQDDELLDGIVAGVNELKLWVGEEIDGAQKLGDIPKARQILQALEPIWELREWSRD
ncbi:hypothetical protein JCM5350_008003 [Sporobolomyces pararoseus]